jgi:WD40 repeat protein
MVEVGRFSMKGQPGQYKRGALSPDKQYLVTDRVNGSGDPNYVPNIETFISQIWNVSTGTLVGRLEGDEASFSPDGKSVLTCARGIRFWETRTGLLFKVGENPSVSRIGSCRLSPDGRYVVGLTDFSGAKIWEASTGRLTADFAPTGALGGALFSPNGTFLVTITYWPHSPATVDLWRPPTGEQIAHVDKPYRVYVTAAFSPDSSTLLVGDHDSPTISVIEPQTGKVMTELPNLGYDPTFSPDGRFVLVRNDMTVRELDFNSRAVVKEAQFHEIVWNASFSPDGRYVLVLTDPVTVVNADNWLLRVSLDGYSDAFFSPDGKMLVTISGDEVVMWQMK